MEKRIEKRLKIIIILLTVLVIGLSGFIVIDKFIRKDNVEEKENSSSTNKTPSESPKPTSGEEIKEPEEKETEISMELAEELYNMIYDEVDDGGSSLFSHYGSEKITPDDFSNLEKNFIVAMNLGRESNHNGKLKYTKEKIIETKNRVLGEDTSFDIINGSGCRQFNLGEDSKYTIEWQCGGEIYGPFVLTKLSKAIQKGNKIYIDQKIIFVDYEDTDKEITTVKYYEDYNKTKLLEEKKFNSFDDYFHRIYEFDMEYRGSIYQYTYQVNDDGTYTFLQIERIK